ncbi:hypothetical protein BN1723_019705 [Verticillium longisporum]|uniref:Uncharacterized protein n=1 Tax=Verticillium longisporum TaxID=100787 RepID=A0A0G4NGB7_VERLO|nr:hypothetical protein BN1723_019705 [Verticillium longisporum]
MTSMFSSLSAAALMPSLKVRLNPFSSSMPTPSFSRRTPFASVPFFPSAPALSSWPSRASSPACRLPPTPTSSLLLRTSAASLRRRLSASAPTSSRALATS